jgi:hypothetical protein
MHTKGRSWLWYAIGIAFVAIILLTWLALFIHQQLNPDQQLQLGQVEAARKLWEAKGSKDYQMLYTVQRGGQQSKDQFFVEIRGGKVQSVVLNGKERLPEDQFDYHSVPGLFRDIEIFLERDARPGSPSTFCRGYFDSTDGHLLLFVRRVIGSTERVEIKVDEFHHR